MRLSPALAFLLLCHSGVAIAESPPAAIADAPTADPEHYTVEFENEHVRVLRIRFPARSVGQMHDHLKSVTVFLTAGNMRMTMPDGTTRTGTPPKGAAIFEPAGPHRPENLSDEDFEAVRIELKH